MFDFHTCSFRVNVKALIGLHEGAEIKLADVYVPNNGPRLRVSEKYEGGVVSSMRADSLIMLFLNHLY